MELILLLQMEAECAHRIQCFPVFFVVGLWTDEMWKCKQSKASTRPFKMMSIVVALTSLLTEAKTSVQNQILGERRWVHGEFLKYWYTFKDTKNALASWDYFTRNFPSLAADDYLLLYYREEGSRSPYRKSWKTPRRRKTAINTPDLSAWSPPTFPLRTQRGHVRLDRGEMLLLQ